MTGLWNDFNSAQDNANLIPKGTLAKVRLTIRPGGFDDPAQGWTGGYRTGPRADWLRRHRSVCRWNWSR